MGKALRNFQMATLSLAYLSDKKVCHTRTDSTEPAKQKLLPTPERKEMDIAIFQIIYLAERIEYKLRI